MKLYIVCTALISILSGFALQFDPVSNVLMPTEQKGMVLHVFGLMAMFIGVALILCSRDLARRAPIVMWEGVLRLGGFAMMAGYGIWGGGGWTMAASGVFDLAIGLSYLVLLPKHLGASAVDLLLDRPTLGRA